MRTGMGQAEGRDWILPTVLLGFGFLAGWVVNEMLRKREEKQQGILEKVVDLIGKNVSGIPYDGNPVRDPNYTVGQYVPPANRVLEADRASQILMYL